MKNVLLLGGCGYIGSAVHYYLSQKYNVNSVDLEWFGNYNGSSNIKQDFDSLTPEFLNDYDVIVHTASNSSVPLCKDIYDSFNNNVTKFLAFTKKIKKQKFIYASSSCVYVESDGTPKVETDLSTPTDGLTLSKTTIDNIMPLLDIEYYGMRFGSVNGWAPNMRTDLMINSMTSSALHKKEVSVFNAHAFRPIISTFDIAQSIEAVIEAGDKRGIYNLSSFNLNIGEIGRRVAEYLGVPLVDNGRTNTYNFTISSEKFKSTFDFDFYSSVESIVQSILDRPYNKNWGRRDSHE
jgi:UDP-glucose 4-epimerase